ncbi:pentapeptide repeat-containing protein [Spirosoma sp. 209]|uniref:pentapeptide repeat-containing protein n=1 Tax=Spirosoma sp. 209 TaxID=1955701 RepID=UPI00098D34CC|nr:pentapeptide repeat-containing protein [Spirosoma sp. 209]
MKTILTSFLLALVLLTPALAQRTVSATEIIDKINRKQTVSYENVTVTGDLDLTSLANRREVRDGNWRGESEEYLSTVEVPLTFRNCRFDGKFLAYRSEEGRFMKISNRVYNADFNEAVTIENCTFSDDAAFKYSAFRQQAQFTGNTFRNEALFKYTKFNSAADFSGSNFRGYADFKYTKFDEQALFAKAHFDRSADFKYTKFDEGVTFKSARFDGNADFKYVHFPRQTNLDDVAFNGGTDFKYTTLNGRRFSLDR